MSIVSAFIRPPEKEHKRKKTSKFDSEPIPTEDAATRFSQLLSFSILSILADQQFQRHFDHDGHPRVNGSTSTQFHR